MIIEVQKNLLETSCDIIAHQTNCVGVMGAGVARQIRDKLLSSVEYESYRKLCSERRSSLLGTVQCLSAKNGKLIFNLFGENVPTGQGLDTDYVALKRAMMELKTYAEAFDMSIAMPGLIGCGLAGGDWGIVYEMINDVFGDSSVTVELCYLPQFFDRRGGK